MIESDKKDPLYAKSDEVALFPEMYDLPQEFLQMLYQSYPMDRLVDQYTPEDVNFLINTRIRYVERALATAKWIQVEAQQRYGRTLTFSESLVRAISDKPASNEPVVKESPQDRPDDHPFLNG